MTTVTSKGQVTIPKPVRDLLGLVPGSKVDFRRTADGAIVLTRKENLPESRFAKWRGRAGKGLLSTDEIMALTRGDK